MPREIDMKATFVAALLLASLAASAAEPVTVLGLPLGGKLKMPIRQCKISDLGKETKSLCWVDAPRAYKNTRSGMVLVPGQDARPSWAANALFSIRVHTDGTLEKIEVERFSQENDEVIRTSVSARWGSPTRLGNSTAEWKRPEIYVSILCYDRKCKTEFLSPDSYKEWMRELDDRKRKDAARPVSP